MSVTRQRTQPQTPHSPRSNRRGVKKRHTAAAERKRSAAAELADLIRRQGVKPVDDLREIERLWPAEFDPDAFLAYLKRNRAMRRASRP